MTDETSENDGAERELLERPHDFGVISLFLDSVLFAG